MLEVNRVIRKAERSFYISNIITLIVCIILVACTSTPPKKIKGIEIVTDKKTSSLVNVIKYEGFSKKQIEKSKVYIKKMDKVINSKCFAEHMEARGLRKTNNKSPSEVVKHLRNSTVKITLVSYYKRFSKVHGYTIPNVSKIWLNEKYHNGASICSEASNLAHELSHKLDYVHAYKSNVYRPFSVPYSINDAFKYCCK